MSERPQPPFPLTDVKALRASFLSNSKAWFDYLVAVDSHTRDMASEKAVLEKTIEIARREHEAALGFLRAEVQSAREFYSEQSRAAQVSAAQVAATPAPVHLSEPVTDPATFSGFAEDLRRFENAVILKLETNADRYTTPLQRVTYVMGLCTHEAKKTVQAKVVKGKPNFADYQDVLALLRKVCVDPAFVQTARKELFALRQSSYEKYSSFISRFEASALEADLELSTLAPYLQKAVNGQLYSKIPSHIEIPSDYHELSALFQLCDNYRNLSPVRENSASVGYSSGASGGYGYGPSGGPINSWW